MNITYNIQGMTCNGCRASVEKKLAGVEGVSLAVVSLEKEEVLLEVDSHISITSFEEVLPDKYVITPKMTFEKERESDSAFAKAKKTSKLLQLKPLFLIFIFIIGASILLNYKAGNWESAMLDFMGLFYVVFSFFKFLDLKGFKNSFMMYDPLAKAIPSYGWIYPFIELGLGLLFLMRLQISVALVVTIVILGITTVGVTSTLLSKKEIQCACLGTALKLPMTEATFIENTIMIVMAAVMVVGLI